MSVKKNAETPGKIGGNNVAKRPVGKVWTVDPNGAGSWHTKENAGDLVNHLGWTLGVAPAAVEAPVPASVPVPAPMPASDADADTAPTKAKDPDLAEVDALRGEATTLGVAVDARWGKKRLKEEIQTAKDHAAA